MRISRKLCVLSILALVFAGSTALAQELPGDGKTVRFVQNDSLGANYVQDQIIKSALEELGYEVDFGTVSIAIFFQAASQGELDMTGDIDWAQRESQYRPVEDKIALVGEGTIQGGGVQGYIIDRKTSEEYGITNIEQLKDPELAKLFDTDGDGKANLVNCDPGWTCGDIIDYQVEEYGLSDTVKTVRAKYEPLMAELITKAKRGEPILFYGWSPSFVTAELIPGEDIVWLPTPYDALPGGTEAIGTLVSGVVGCAGGQDPCRLTNQPWTWKIAANREFLKENPAVEKLAETVGWPSQTWSEWEVKMGESNNPNAIRAIADQWIEQNRETFDEWIASALTSVE